jgi:hypothetical protein
MAACSRRAHSSDRQRLCATTLNQVHHGDLKALRLRKTTEVAVAEAEALHKQLDRCAYGLAELLLTFRPNFPRRDLSEATDHAPG